jgi:hypothetical protein
MCSREICQFGNSGQSRQGILKRLNGTANNYCWLVNIIYGVITVNEIDFSQ